MKLKFLAILILGISIANNILATEKPVQSYQKVIDGFVSSFLNNDHKLLKGLLSDDAVYSFNRDVRVVKHGATAVVNEMRKNGNVAMQNCDVKSKIVTATDALVMAQIDINFSAVDNKQKNYLVLERTKDGEWKITNVYKFYVSSNDDIKEKKNIAV
ncbi:MAG: nuclear transport factor 2 family protein [Pedobacter sp.]|uniref:nuclear transport factor 2 family protein n=1 Tax=Pedobacter sp. TaxID=1411316 RepID=UPI002806CA86|nr:nuclear transport factor 2 family protein [Pedobacter sp.]MDQ8006559.1 nuclear transport factor 2 family protein [Pedobacter sp.]